MMATLLPCDNFTDFCLSVRAFLCCTTYFLRSRRQLQHGRNVTEEQQYNKKKLSFIKSGKNGQKKVPEEKMRERELKITQRQRDELIKKTLNCLCLMLIKQCWRQNQILNTKGRGKYKSETNVRKQAPIWPEKA